MIADRIRGRRKEIKGKGKWSEDYVRVQWGLSIDITELRIRNQSVDYHETIMKLIL